MPQKSRKRSRSDFAFSYVFVTIHSSAQSNLRIVHVKHRHAIQPDRALDLPDGGRQPALALDVVSRREQMCRIKARPRRQILQPGHDFPNLVQPRTNRRAHSRRVLDQDLQSTQRRALRRLLHRLHNRRDGLFVIRLAPRTRMHHQKIRSQRRRTHDFIVECLDRTRPQHRLRRRQVDEVVRMNRQRPEPQFFPPRAKRLRIHLRNTSRPALPHPRACRKDLQRVAAELPRRFQRVQVAPCNRGVNADSKAPIHPGGRPWFGFWFRAVFVFRIEFCRLGDGLFRHAC